MHKAQTTANPLGKERIGKLLKGFAIPGIISMGINSLYNMVHQIFISHGVGMLGNDATKIIALISTYAIAIASLFGDGLATYFSLFIKDMSIGDSAVFLTDFCDPVHGIIGAV